MELGIPAAVIVAKESVFCNKLGGHLPTSSVLTENDELLIWTLFSERKVSHTKPGWVDADPEIL